jgi:ribulose-5-phosphate 4-epimerase/fuculose-1-phosphate aldolase
MSYRESKMREIAIDQTSHSFQNPCLSKLQCDPLSQDVPTHDAIYRRKKQIEAKEISFVIPGYIITYRIVFHFHNKYGLSLAQNIIFHGW